MNRVLVAYGSKNGSTAEIAAAVAEELRAQGLAADCVEASKARDLAQYDAVVLGSAVYMKRWRRSARRFLHRHRQALAQTAFWVFSSGPVGEQSDERKTAEWAEPKTIVATVERLGAREHVVFGGRVPVEPHNFIERAMLRDTPPEFADLRDWKQIREWARTIAASVGGHAGASGATSSQPALTSSASGTPA